MYEVNGFDGMPLVIERHVKKWTRSNVLSGNKSELETTIQKWGRDNVFPGYISIIVPYISHYIKRDKTSVIKPAKKKMYVIYSREDK